MIVVYVQPTPQTCAALPLTNDAYIKPLPVAEYLFAVPLICAVFMTDHIQPQMPSESVQSTSVTNATLPVTYAAYIQRQQVVEYVQPAPLIRSTSQ